ncbi:methionine biosynthesis protein MetW [candidate division WOR-1 bacterium RIFOXYC2_FULL_37_10]|uniref:Methionine biosynthesis protein MetW n=1 Tax=candidate division WOR-1 bacterium RIFOXYB2_FULL_37_13 TaxID=1802579 RepID=A0A1F4SHL9_UNCSA|nr:MAG: methionine biosynthesis protein MetW [candidate division WOR-1 bacterium RIFOXYB2_FULL_37_13]OGC37003.1 MAG: methionine biosynthesis protein MetW [candidate division WOR-1 bacterium RIFOXYC2_FULL_37_10]
MIYKETIKPDHKIIADFISDNSKVLDLGCNDGALLDSLIKNKNVKGFGVDNSPENINICLKKGLSVLQLDLNKGLASFDDDFFDFVVLNMTLQAVYNPAPLISDMIRVGKKAVVGFPNFGHWKLLLDLLFTQRMPKTKTLPYEWYDTPNIRLMTIKDFKVLCEDKEIKILKEIYLDESGANIYGSFINWRAVEGIFLISK